MKICIAGKNEIAVAGLELALSRFAPGEIVVCPNRTDDGGPGWQPSLRRFAREHGVAVIELQDVEQERDLVLVSLEFDRLLRPARFATQRLYNIHFSLLPAYKGMYTSAWPLINGASQTGVTLHYIDIGIDTGDIIDTESFPIDDSWTCRDMYFAYMAHAERLLRRNWDTLLRDALASGSAQQPRGSTYYGKGSLDFSDCDVSARRTAVELVNRVRGYHFREYQIPRVGGMPVGAWQIGERSRKGPGEIVDAGSDHITVSTIDFDVRFSADRSWRFFEHLASRDFKAMRGEPSGQNINFRNRQGWTPLIVAAFNGDYEGCRELIACGGEVNCTNPNGTTALMYAKEHAVRTGDFSVCTLLLDAGAAPAARDRFGKTVVDHALARQQEAAVRFFAGMAAA